MAICVDLRNAAICPARGLSQKIEAIRIEALKILPASVPGAVSHFKCRKSQVAFCPPRIGTCLAVPYVAARLLRPSKAIGVSQQLRAPCLDGENYVCEQICVEAPPHR